MVIFNSKPLVYQRVSKLYGLNIIGTTRLIHFPQRPRCHRFSCAAVPLQICSCGPSEGLNQEIGDFFFGKSWGFHQKMSVIDMKYGDTMWYSCGLYANHRIDQDGHEVLELMKWWSWNLWCTRYLSGVATTWPTPVCLEILVVLSLSVYGARFKG